MFFEGFENPTILKTIWFSILNKKYCLKDFIRTVNVILQNNIYDLFLLSFENLTFFIFVGFSILHKILFEESYVINKCNVTK